MDHMSETPGALTPNGGTAVAERPADEAVTQNPWVTIVWDDPINTQVYVTHVFVTYFHYPKAKARRLMLQVHNEGKAVVASGSREEMERDCNAMHQYGLWATLDRAE
jgi:ATP-dependent Clp protease adaptor protein ClpS